MCELMNFITPINLSEYTLIIPSVSVGNVPQLTVDLLISTYNLKKVATIWHPGVVPLVSSDPFRENNSEVCTACELYAKEDIKVATIQLRTCLDSKYTTKFFSELCDKITQLKLKSVVVLSSSFAHEMHDVQSSKYRYESNHAPEEVFAKHNVLKLDDESVVHGGGFAGKLYAILSPLMKSTLLVKYTSEGDNRPDAIQMLDLLHHLMGSFVQKNVVFPVSWKHLFGNPPPVGIY